MSLHYKEANEPVLYNYYLDLSDFTGTLVHRIFYNNYDKAIDEAICFYHLGFESDIYLYYHNNGTKEFERKLLIGKSNLEFMANSFY